MIIEYATKPHRGVEEASSLSYAMAIDRLILPREDSKWIDDAKI